MNRQDIIALAIRMIAANTTLIRKPDPIESFITDIFGMETYDQRLARSIEVEAAKLTKCAKTAKTNRTFKKITEKI
jgi:hypothetical protein